MLLREGTMRRGCRRTRGLVALGIMLLCAIPVSALLTCSSGQAQEDKRMTPLGRTDDLPLMLPREAPAVPPLTPEGTLPPGVGEVKERLAPGLRVFVREIKVTGSTAFTEPVLAAITAPYRNREVTSEDLEALRRALTLHYVNKGYVNSGAVLPDQEIVNGVMTFRIVEGQLTTLEVEGNRWLRDSYYKKRIELGADPPLNIESLRERLQLLQQDDRIRQLHGELRPGLKPGESELKLKIEETLPFSVLLGANNYQSPTVGAIQGFVNLAHRSLTGHGDVLNFTYWSSGDWGPQMDAWYAFPLTARDTTLTLRYRKSDLGIVEEPFEQLNIVTQSDTYEISLRHPLIKNLNHELAIGFTGDYIHNETTLLGEPFSFYAGAEDGKSTITALRFFQEWIYRTPIQVVAARSRFSVGIDAFGATVNPSSLPGGQFFAWLGQFQYARILKPWDIQAILRADLQVSNDPLLPVEQIPVGGRYSVRGYRENQLVRDNAVIASLEFRIPLVRDKSWADYLQLAPFFDFGNAWNTELPTFEPRNLASIGIGLRWGGTVIKHPFPIKPEFEIYYGYGLFDSRTDGDNLQDMGVHMQFTIAAF